jgi:hypothetical protein
MLTSTAECTPAHILHRDLRGCCSYYIRTEDEDILRCGTYPIEENPIVSKFAPDFEKKFYFTEEGCVKVGPMYAVCTDGDGNCLLHAVSISLWGIHDREGPVYISESDSFISVPIMRTALANFMNNFANSAVLRLHYKAAERRFNTMLSSSAGFSVDSEDEQMEQDFLRELKEPEIPGKYLTAFHVYCLANVLRRPIVVYGDPPSGDNRMRGIYLPTM